MSKKLYFEVDLFGGPNLNVKVCFEMVSLKDLKHLCRISYMSGYSIVAHPYFLDNDE